MTIGFVISPKPSNILSAASSSVSCLFFSNSFSISILIFLLILVRNYYMFFETILLKLEKALMEDIATEKVYAKIEDEKNEFSLIKH